MHICLFALIGYYGVLWGILTVRERRLQNKDLTIEAYMTEKIDRYPIIAAIYAKEALYQNFSVNVRTQVCNCWNYCAEKGWKVEYIFIDWQERADKKSKLNFETLIRKVKSGDFDVIVFLNLDKFNTSILSVSGKRAWRIE